VGCRTSPSGRCHPPPTATRFNTAAEIVAALAGDEDTTTPPRCFFTDPVEPTALLFGLGKHLAQRGPEPERAVADGERRGAHPASRGVARQVRPGPLGLPVPVGQRDQLLRAVRAHAREHQQAHPLLLETDVDVHPVGPHVDVVRPGRVAVAERAGLVLPLRGQPGDRRRREPAPAPRNLSTARPKSCEDNPCRHNNGSTSLTFGDCRAHGGRTACARRWPPRPACR
jgi:hypothetical protein